MIDLPATTIMSIANSSCASLAKILLAEDLPSKDTEFRIQGTYGSATPYYGAQSMCHKRTKQVESFNLNARKSAPPNLRARMPNN